MQSLPNNLWLKRISHSFAYYMNTWRFIRQQSMCLIVALPVLLSIFLPKEVSDLPQVTALIKSKWISGVTVSNKYIPSTTYEKVKIVLVFCQLSTLYLVLCHSMCFIVPNSLSFQLQPSMFVVSLIKTSRTKPSSVASYLVISVAPIHYPKFSTVVVVVVAYIIYTTIILYYCYFKW